VKRAIALFRGGLDAEYKAVRQQLEQQFPGAKVTLGGREIVAADYFKGLDTEAQAKPAPAKITSDTAFRGLAPADGAKPVWQFRFLEEQDLTAIEESMRNWYGAASFSSFLPAAATDGERIYGNWLGACFAIDVATGKTVWSTEPGVKKIVSSLKGNYARMVSYSANPAQFSLTLAQIGEGTRIVLAISASQSEVNLFHLVAYDAVTGRQLWSTDRATREPTKASYIGTPLVDGDSVYALSHQVTPETNQNANGENGPTASAVSLRRLDLRTGTELWSLTLGTPQLVGNGYGQQLLPTPALLVSGGYVYVLTNDGALLAVSADRRQIDWVFKYPAPNYGQNRGQFFIAARTPGVQPRTTGPIVVRDGVIYFKESLGPTLYALDERGPRLRWKWEDSELTNLVGVDDSDVYLFYGELSAISRNKPETRWSNRLTVELPGVGAQVGSQAILVFTPRGLFELSKETGDVRRIFRGADLGAAGGFVLAAGKRLISVSNLAVTAYPDSANN
jgi:outer membrane protein assembly factor BamB